MRRSVGASRKLPALFVVLTAMPLVALGWLGLRALDQDRAIESRRLRDQLDSSAALLSHEVEQNLTTWEGMVAAAAQGKSAVLPADAVLLTFDDHGLRGREGARLPYYPQRPAPAALPEGVFAAAEFAEFRDGDLVRAAALYRALAARPDRPLRAAALTRLARCLRKKGNAADALATYAKLAAMGDTPVAGSPSELLARRERIELFEAIGNKDASAHEAALLASALSDRRFLIDRATFDFFSESAAPPLRADASRAMADALGELWPLCLQQADGRAACTRNGYAFVAVWRRARSAGAVLVGSVDMLMAPSLPGLERLQVALALDDPSGLRAWGTLPASGISATKTSRETGLPWTIRVATEAAAAEQVGVYRRRLLAAGFSLMVLVIAAAGYFVFRSVNRELGVARLQSEFVAAVSHEFRTPLTAMRHLIEMLEEGAPHDRHPLYFRALGRETRRLHGMVESLLDFGRMEAGRRVYQMEDADAVVVAKQVVDDFLSHVPDNSHHLELQTSNVPAIIRADRDALAVALRNLLDNAMKYSPASSTVTLSVAWQGALVGICVEDHGPGIPKQEQR
ncbi:MAG: sensor histidine kinase, partial [Burkholderiales bacterium]